MKGTQSLSLQQGRRASPVETPCLLRQGKLRSRNAKRSLRRKKQTRAVQACLTGVRELEGCLVQRGYELGLYSKRGRSSPNRVGLAIQPASTLIWKALGKTEICRSVKQEIRSLMPFARRSHKGSMAANLTEINVPLLKRTPDGKWANAAN